MSATYNLFTRLEEPEICCAIPQTSPLPRFVKGDAWRYDGIVEEPDLWERGFRDGVAAWGAARNGFYVFHDLPHRRGRRIEA
jgi:hypothetical protein